MIKNDFERQVLTLHAAGATVDAICDQLGRTTREVNEVLTRLSRFDRAVDQLAALLDRARATGQPRLRKLAERIAALVTDLRAQLAGLERQAHLRLRIAGPSPRACRCHRMAFSPNEDT